MQYIPRKYQAAATQHIIDHEQAGLFLDMGLGKTVSTLTAIDELIYDRFSVSKVLVIAPKRVAYFTWPAELQKWDHLKDLRMVVIEGTPAERKAALQKDADVYVISRDLVVWLKDELKGCWPFDMLVLDELSSFKSSKAKRFRALKGVPSKRVLGLTGTPGSIMDLWAEMYLLDKGKRLGRTLTGFREQYFTPGRRNGNIVYDWDPKPFAEEAVLEKIDDICISMKQEDYLELPEQIEETIFVEMPESAQADYKRLAKQFVLQLNDSEITAANAAVCSGFLQQIANGAIYSDDEAYTVLHDAKLDAVEEIIEAAGEPVLVYYHFIHDLERLKARFPEVRVLKSSKDLIDWDHGKIPVALAHPQSVGHGLNLQRGGHIIIWFGLDWWLEGYLQANARLHRQGQEKPVLVYHIVTKGTIDERILKALQNKKIDQDLILDSVKAEVGI